MAKSTMTVEQRRLKQRLKQHEKLKRRLGLAKLVGAILKYLNLESARLLGGNLTSLRSLRSGAYLEGANLQGADLSGVYHLEGAILMDANLEGANLEGARNVPLLSAKQEEDACVSNFYYSPTAWRAATFT
jgi:uncharacterized protein YjbI with pentapeptide repeats